jgi:hypothetical protein
MNEHNLPLETRIGPPTNSNPTEPRVFRSRVHKNAVYTLMLDRIDCGPFDGGCLVFARALERLHGGQVLVVEGRCFSGWACFRVPRYDGPLLAQHAVLRLPDGRYMDALGACSERDMLARATQEALYIALPEAIRELRAGDLPDAVHDEDFATELAALLGTAPRRAATRRHRPR